jgi:hypothetical protein
MVARTCSEPGEMVKGTLALMPEIRDVGERVAEEGVVLMLTCC